MTTWNIVSAEERHVEYGDTFDVPDIKVRSNLKVGAIVKLIFELKNADSRTNDVEAERIWVEVTDKAKDGGYIGRVDNDPVVISDLRADDTVKFTAENVIAVWED